MKEAERIAKKVLRKELAKKVEELSEEKQEDILPKLQKLEEFMDSFLNEKRDYKLEIDPAIYCVMTFEWYDKPKDGCPHEWEQTKDEPEWGEWTCKVCGGRGRADVWE